MLLHRILHKTILPVVIATGLCLCGFEATAQKRYNVNGEATAYMSIHSAREMSGMSYASIYYKKNFFEARYNYEDTKTLSFFWGHPFNISKKADVEIIPSIGFSAGNFIGFSPAVQLSTEHERFELYSMNQYSICATDVRRSFFFNWTEALYKFKKVVKLGAALQYTELMPQKNRAEGEAAESTHLVDVGPVIGFQYKKYYLCGYFFNFWEPKRHYAIGFTYSFR